MALNEVIEGVVDAGEVPGAGDDGCGGLMLCSSLKKLSLRIKIDDGARHTCAGSYRKYSALLHPKR